MDLLNSACLFENKASQTYIHLFSSFSHLGFKKNAAIVVGSQISKFSSVWVPFQQVSALALASVFIQSQVIKPACITYVAVSRFNWLSQLTVSVQELVGNRFGSAGPGQISEKIKSILLSFLKKTSMALLNICAFQFHQYVLSWYGGRCWKPCLSSRVSGIIFNTL